jgi:predicted transglutaminase-like cysteine proteinase
MNKAMGMTLVLALVAAVVGFSGPAGAGQNAMKTGARTTQPIGHYEFCQRYQQDCRQKSPKRAPVGLTRALWATLINVNNHVNATVAPRTDMEIWGVEERWSYPVNGQGDCEDYALEKRRLLMAEGVPASDLLITVVRQRNGDGHAVLTVRTSLGDFILDNLEGRILAWTDTDYTYIKRQSEQNSGAWVKINDGRADAVASVE